MNKSIFVLTVIGVIVAVMIAANTGVLQDANATTISPSASK